MITWLRSLLIPLGLFLALFVVARPEWGSEWYWLTLAAGLILGSGVNVAITGLEYAIGMAGIEAAGKRKDDDER